MKNTIKNHGFTSDLPFIYMKGLLVRPTDGRTWTDNGNGDTFIPVEIKKGDDDYEYKLAQLHTEVDCDGTFHQCSFIDEYTGDVEKGEFNFAHFNDLELLWKHND